MSRKVKIDWASFAAVQMIGTSGAIVVKGIPTDAASGVEFFAYVLGTTVVGFFAGVVIKAYLR